MSLLAKVFVVMQAVLVMVYLGMTASLYQHRRDWRTSYMKLKGRYSLAVSRAQKEVDALRNFVKAKNELVEAKEREVRSLKTQVDQAFQTSQRNANLFQQKSTEFQRLQEDFQSLSTRLDQAMQNNNRLQDRKNELEGLLDTATTRRTIAEGQVARLTNLTTSLEGDLGNLRQTFAETRKQLRDKELLISMAESQGFNFETLIPGPPVPAIDGKVVAVKNDISPPLVLLSVGADDKVQQGFHFSVYRGSTFVGKVVVERVLRDSAGCRVLFTADGQDIQSGDSAATRLN